MEDRLKHLQTGGYKELQASVLAVRYVMVWSYSIRNDSSFFCMMY